MYVADCGRGADGGMGGAVSKVKHCQYILEQLPEMTRDEAAVTRQFVEQLMGEGRREYGPLNLDTDSRTVEELLRNLADEGLDRTFYAIVARMKMGQG